MVCPDGFVKVKSDVMACEVEGEMILLHRGKGIYYGLNRSGSVLWKWMEEPIRVADLCGRLADQYGISPERAWADVKAFLEHLWAEDLIDVEPATRP